MKKNILTIVATATLFTGLSLSSATAASLLVESGVENDTDADANISIDIVGQGTTDVNMTFIPKIDASPGSSFTMQFINGGFDGQASITLCNGADKVGNLLTRGTLDANGLMVNPTFQFDPNADQSKIVQDTNITFNTESNCSLGGAPEIISATTDTCAVITAQVVDGKSTQGTSFRDYDTDVFKIGTTRQFIKIACSAPECFVSNDKHSFISSSTPAGVNVPLSPISAYATGLASIIPDTNATDASCPTCPTATIAGETTCTTRITIKNDALATNTDLNITKLDFVATFAGTLGADMNVTIDNNNTVTGYTLGSTFSPNDINLAGGEEVNLTIVYTLKDTNTLELGNVMGTISGLETNNSVAVTSAFTNKVITEMKSGPQTQFTVPYMSSAGASQANFVKVSTLVGAGSTTLSATISDATGNSCAVTYTDIPANGGSTFIFASALPTGADYQALIPSGECTNLTSDLYSVKFQAGASVNAVGYMRTKRGERTIDIF